MPASTYGVGTFGVAVYGGASLASLISVSPTTLTTSAGATTITFTGSGTSWVGGGSTYGAGTYGGGTYSGSAGGSTPTITASAGVLSALTITSNTTATATYTPPSTAQTVTFTDTTDGSSTVTMAITSVAALTAVTPNTLPAGAGPSTITFTGTGTNWVAVTNVPAITASAGSLGARTVVSTTSATATYTPPATSQNVVFTDTTDNNTTVLLSIPVIPIVVPPQIGNAPPALVVEVSFSTNPTHPPVWVDITKYVQGNVSINRGRQRELDRVQAGVLSCTLDNRDRRFDPTYTSSPYYPNVLPMRRIRVRATYSNDSYPLYSGYVDSWGQSWAGWQDATVPITASDAFKPLNLAQLNMSFPAQRSDVRVNAVLDAINWTTNGAIWVLGTSLLGSNTFLGPTGDRVVSTGSSVIQPSVLVNTSALEHLQDVVETEMGLLFTDRSGALNFFGRAHTTLGSLGTFGELEMPYVDLLMDYSDTNIWNDIEITRQGGTQQRATNTTSQDQYYIRTLSKTSTLQDTDTAAQTMATAMLAKYAQPILEIVAITLDGQAQPTAIFPQMLTRELGDRVTVRRRPPGGGALIEQVSLIQGISTTFNVAGGDWSTTWRLTPTDSAVYWKLGDAAYGLLSTTTRLSW